MKRNVIVSLIAVALLSALSAIPGWAAPPFGSFGGIVGGGNSGAGLLPLTGWALDDNGILAVDVLVDGLVAGRAAYGRARAGVTARFPGFPDSAAPGWGIQIDTTHYLNGLHTVSVRVKSRSGEVVFLPSQVINFTNVQANLAPFGVIEFPKAQAELRGNCDLYSPTRRYAVVSGYALDAGTTPADTGVAYVELLIDRAVGFDPDPDPLHLKHPPQPVEYNSDIACTFSATKGGQTNCYGIRRLDVEQVYPSLTDSPHSGFRFVLDIGNLVNPLAGYSQGAHILTIRAGDHASQVRDIAEIPVTFTCDQNLTNEASFGDIDLPLNGLLYHGVINVTGWALDWDGVANVQIFTDGHPFSFATRGIPRPDVSALSYYPGYPDIATPGWQYALDTRLLQNGEHFIDVVVTDTKGVSTYIGKRRIVVNNVGG
jgi:N-acetylmuramoyl-L-alanine amidase